MRYLGLDVGTKTIGVAISDKTNQLCAPFKVIRFSNITDTVLEIKNIILENNITDVVIGLPKNMDGTCGFAAQRSYDFKELLEQNIEQNIHLMDERLSTLEAEKILIDRDYSRDKRKKIIDGVAAVLILESFLKMKGD